MAHGTIVGIYRLLHLIAEEAHLAPQIILHAPLYEILYRLLPLLAIRQIKHHALRKPFAKPRLANSA